MKIVTVVGARPQFIKAAAVSRIIRRHNDVKEVLVHTGQHFDDNMSKIFFEELEISAADYNLGINSLNHGAMTGRMLEAVEDVLLKEKPDWVLVYGDTNSTIAGALAAKKIHLRVAHVEAGMRSFTMKMPEEINRVLTDRISDLLFCSTDEAVENLKREGFKEFDCRIIRSGDVMFDAALYYAEKAQKVSSIMKKIPFTEFVLCTLHREENVNDKDTFRKILNTLSIVHREIPVVMPLHPRTQKAMEQLGNKIPLHFIKPVGYLDMLQLMQHCRLVITDSGGLQKEAFFFSKFCITLREETEWVELVDLKVNRTVGASEKKILKAFHSCSGKPMKTKAFPYGKGNASEKIVKELIAIG